MLNHSRILLCASPGHCAKILQAAAQTRVALHGLQPYTQWPQGDMAHNAIVLWALLPPQAHPVESALELRWREQWLQSPGPWTIQMLYGSATQQAEQLKPWIAQKIGSKNTDISADCMECLDASSEQKLFQHLLQRK